MRVEDAHGEQALTMLEILKGKSRAKSSDLHCGVTLYLSQQI